MYREFMSGAIEHLVKHEGNFGTHDLPWMLWASIAPPQGGMPKSPPFDEKTGRPNFNARAFNEEEMNKMRKAYFYINYWGKSGGMDKWKP